LSFRATRRALEEVVEKGVHPAPPEVFELRYVKASIRINGVGLELWFYMGRERDYVLIPGVYCSCRDFTLRTIINKTSSFCKHQVGLYSALARGRYVELDLSMDEAYVVVRELLDKGLSLALRRRISRRS
jgi:predicted nucleic acid-binding Zn finger protein